MLDRVLTHHDLTGLIDRLRTRWRLVGPVRRDVPACDPPYRYFYEHVESAEELTLAFDRCVESPKRFLLPAREPLFQYDRAARGFRCTPILEREPTAIIGVHPCDLHAIRMLDHVFDCDVPDEHYLARRTHTLIIGIDCPGTCDDRAFCGDLGTNEIDTGFDVLLIPLDEPRGEDFAPDDRFGVLLGSDAGRSWILGNGNASASREPEPIDERACEVYRRAKDRGFPRRLRTPAAELPGLLGRSYDSLLWEATARRCYSCGSCNLVCPTCYCFDICDENGLPPDSGRRVREWDGCMLREFALVAGPHNFRASRGQRLRHRIFRKGKWIGERTGLHGCVGCARCDRACTANISIVDIFNQLAEEG